MNTSETSVKSAVEELTPAQKTIYIQALPPACLSQNSREHWAAVRKERITWQSIIFYALYAKFGAPTKEARFKVLVVQWEYVFKDNRKRDTRNFIAIGKAGDDVLKLWNVKSNPCGFGLIHDDSPDYLSIEPDILTVDKTRAPMTILRIKEGN